MDDSFAVIGRNRLFLLVMAAGSIGGTFIGGLLLGVVPSAIVLPILAGILLNFGSLKCGSTNRYLGRVREVKHRCQSALEWDPLSASKRDPFDRRVLLVALAASELAGVAETARARVV